MRIALIGTRGAPATYGGYETCVEEVGARLSAAGHDVVLYCRSTPGGDRSKRHKTYRGMELVWLPALRRRSLETLSHTMLSVVHALAGPRMDAVVLFNAANAPFLPLLKLWRVPVATHVDGLEWRRAKWGPGGRRYYRLAESMAVRWSNALIADAEGIRGYYEAEFGASSVLIRYGALVLDSSGSELLGPVNLLPNRYHLVVARLEPENHVDVIIDGYVKSRAVDPLVVVGSAPYADRYVAMLRVHKDSRVRFLGSVWDQDLLNALYANASSYLHGHSVGGTNPSLLRAIGGGAPTDAYDVSFNREVLGDDGRYWSCAADVTQLVESTENDRGASRSRGEQLRRRALDYDWDDVASGYEQLCVDLVSRRLRMSGATGRRRKPGWSG